MSQPGRHRHDAIQSQQDNGAEQTEHERRRMPTTDGRNNHQRQNQNPEGIEITRLANIVVIVRHLLLRSKKLSECEGVFAPDAKKPSTPQSSRKTERAPP